jgi:carboxypeptidase C (cathepsin A)
VKSFSGYISLPSSLFDPTKSPEYQINTFFWFFESRKNPQNAPLGIWFGGGPGYSSVQSALGENGPCSVNTDSNSTTLNPWSWNNEVNMLYIDQPNMVGYSYDSLVNGTMNQAPTDAASSHAAMQIVDFSKNAVPSTNDTFFVGTFPS